MDISVYRKRRSELTAIAIVYRHRGKMQLAPYRTAVWAKDGLKDRARNLKDKVTGTHRREETVASEA